MLVVPALLLGAATAALHFDCRLSGWVMEGNCPDFLEELFNVVESFGHGIGVMIIALAIFQLDPRRRWGIPRLLLMSLGAGMAANGVKMLITRVRPRHFDFAGDVWTTFGDLLPFAGAGSDGQSFPSAHVATAVGLAVALVWLYPRGRWLFPLLAVLVACQRVGAGVHFLSDVLFGATLGYLVALASIWPNRVTALYDRLELALQRWGAKGKGPRPSQPVDEPGADESFAGHQADPGVSRRAA